MDDLYDEFGNYIGGAGSEEEEETPQQAQPQTFDYDLESEEEASAAGEAAAPRGDELMDVDEGPSNQVILHEDKQYYPSAAQTYGADVEALVEEEDTQPLTQPIVEPVKHKKHTIQESSLPPLTYSREFMADLLNYPDQTRNVAVVGHLHHGKTALMDALVLVTHSDMHERLGRRTGRKRDEQMRYTDVSYLERERGVSMKAAPMSLVLQSSKGKSHLFNIVDTPGHVDFADEVAAGLRLADGAVLVVDVVEGVQAGTEQVIRHIVREGIPLVLIVNKIDRLIPELKLPPGDAYFKIKHVIEEVNSVIEATVPGEGERWRVSPEKGNVTFACADMGWAFTLQSFAAMYAQQSNSRVPIDASEFAKRLWGDVFFSPSTRKFTRKGAAADAKRAFVHFVLEPIYKLFSATISQSPEDLKQTLSGLGIKLKPSQLTHCDARELMQAVSAQFFGPIDAGGLVDMIVSHVPSPVEGAARYLEKYYTGPLDSGSRLIQGMQTADPEAPLVVHVTKLFSTQDGTRFNALGRVLSGTAAPGAGVRVLGEGYSADDEEDMVGAAIGETWIAESRYDVTVSSVPAGNWVLMSGVDNSIVKTATVVDAKLFTEGGDERPAIFKPISHFTESVFKVAVEPINPSELPKMLEGLRKINKSYPLVSTKVEESGEHVVLGTGELYMDSVMHDLRRVYAEMEVRVSDPVTRFAETVVETSALMAYAITPNKKNKVTMVAELLEDGIAEDIERGRVRIRDPIRKVAKWFEEKYEWDKLAARSIWAFGPEEWGANVLVDDTLPSQVDKKVLGSVRESVRQGFSWGTREGPLCEEPIRNTKFRLTDISLADQPIFRGGGQIIPTTRRALYSSFLLASPRLMEPIYSCSMTGPADSVSGIYKVLSRRRGHVLSDAAIAGTPLYRVEGLIPVIDSFGFETDLRIHTQGQTALSLVFDRWSVVPGDPLDRSPEARTRPLEMAGARGAARDFMLKTRRRKGLSEDVSVSKFLEPELWKGLKESGVLGEI